MNYLYPLVSAFDVFILMCSGEPEIQSVMRLWNFWLLLLEMYRFVLLAS